MFEQILGKDNNIIIIIILVVAICFIVYNGIKKQKKEKIQRKSREKAVKKMIKKHLAISDNLKNIFIEYKDVKLRNGKKYQKRDIYDVFIEIKEPRTKKPITKKAYEIEGIAIPNPDKEKDNDDFDIEWKINKEFKYREHINLLSNKDKKTLFGIYIRSIFKKKRKEFIKKEKEKLHKDRKKLEDIHNNLIQNKDEVEVFKPEVIKKK